MAAAQLVEFLIRLLHPREQPLTKTPISANSAYNEEESNVYFGDDE
jgi:hypothetical protein